MVNNFERWLITGGAGYIGAHVVRAFRNAGLDVLVVDDLSTGSPDRIRGTTLIEGSTLDEEVMVAVMREHGVTGVVHLAARKVVAESVADPLLYYKENVGGTVSLLSAMRRSGVNRIVYSSSAAVYGISKTTVVSESAPCYPLNPYGETKLIGEQLLRAEREAHGLRYAALRYFNVGGAVEPRLGDRGSANLIPMLFTALADGRHPQIFGADYETPDGTCVRDYVHVNDVASAHVAAARLLNMSCGKVYNVGCGRGYSVREVLHAVAAATGIATEPVVSERRPGDAASVIADVTRIRAELNWCARHDLTDIVRSAWESRDAPLFTTPVGAGRLTGSSTIRPA